MAAVTIARRPTVTPTNHQAAASLTAFMARIMADQEWSCVNYKPTIKSTGRAAHRQESLPIRLGAWISPREQDPFPRGERPASYLIVDTRWATACFNFGDTDVGYVNGFRMAADLAVEHVVATNTRQDYLVYPIVFGYRQYLELRMKGLLVDATSYLDLPDPDPAMMGRHRLGPIWQALEPRLVEIFGEDGQWELIGERVAEFDRLDADSFAFRYASNKDGSPSLPGDLFWISLTNLRATIEKIADSLDACDMGLSHYLDQKAENQALAAEQQAEYQAEWADQ